MAEPSYAGDAYRLEEHRDRGTPGAQLLYAIFWRGQYCEGPLVIAFDLWMAAPEHLRDRAASRAFANGITLAVETRDWCERRLTHRRRRDD